MPEWGKINVFDQGMLKGVLFDTGTFCALFWRDYMSEYAYVRHYSGNQEYELELSEVKKKEVDGVFIDDQVEDLSNKEQLSKLLEMIVEGDIVYFSSIEHLGRNYTEIGEVWRTITIEKKADICVLNMDLLNTRKYRKQPADRNTADLVLELLTYFSERERVQAKAIQADGIERAQSEDVTFGRPACEIPDDFEKIVDDWIGKKIPLYVALERSNMSRATWYRRVKELRQGKLETAIAREQGQ